MALDDLVTKMMSSKGSNLKGFLSKFNSSEGLYVNTIDPLHTFDVTMSFYPMIGGGEESVGTLKKIGNAIVSAAQGAVRNASNNLTGGLVGSLMNDVQLTDLRDKFVQDANFGKTTFLDYVSRGNLLTTDDTWFGGASEKSVSP